MITDFHAMDYKTERSKTVSVDIVKKCPLCHTGFNGEVVNAVVFPYGTSGSSILYVTHFCAACESGFFAIYLRRANRDTFLPLQSFPQKPEPEAWPDNIKALSPKFIEIYEQSHKAEDGGLLEICGMGYRKSLEFLIKDYLIYKNPNDKDIIEEMSLSNCISNKVKNDKIKTVANRCNWLSNDHTHYQKRYEEYDLSDLKDLIEATVYWVSYEITTDNALAIEKR